MRYTYSIGIRTYNGAERVNHLLTTLALCDLSMMKDKVVVEDYYPTTNHDLLRIIVDRFPGWRLVSCPEWVNMQGTAQRILEECKTDFVFQFSDDTLCGGDPIRNVVKWLETCSKDLADHTGGIAPTVYSAIPDLIEHKILNPPMELDTPLFYHKLQSKIDKYFYNTDWIKTVKNTQLNSNVAVPSLGRNVHGSAYLLSRRYWELAGGFDPRWHADDQQISYKIWLNTNGIIYTLPTDPIFHCGSQAQNDKVHPEANAQSSFDRCEEIFGMSIRGIEADLGERIHKQALKYQERLQAEWNQMGFYWRFV